MEDLLEDLGVRHELLTSDDRPFKEYADPRLVRVLYPDEIHRAIRGDEDHRSISDSGEEGSPAYPRSTSASISSISPAG